MLTQLTIQNFGLIDRLTIEFLPGLNVLTGATGAGKSIIIEGLRFALGERLKNAQVREPSKPCVIEAVFDIRDKALRRLGIFEDFLEGDSSPLIINRQFLPDGHTKIKVNGFSVTIAQLKAIGDRLVDFHGPHDHQMLLAQEAHLGLLDQLVDFKDMKQAYAERFDDYTGIQEQLKNIQQLRQSRERDLDLLGHQIKELEQVPLTQAVYEEVCQQIQRMNNAEKLYEAAAGLLQILEGQDGGVADLVRKAFAPLRVLKQFDDKAASFEDMFNQIQQNNEQLIMELRDYLQALSYEPGQANELNRRFDIYDDIQRKYGPGMAAAGAFYEDAKKKYELLVNLEHNDQELREKFKACEEELKKCADQLTAARKKTATKLKATIIDELKDLGIEHVDFDARISPYAFHRLGQDEVVFYISPNAGEPLKPMAEIVSSGEAARVMLALKKALIKVDPIPVLIFDEIDAQIGGRLGTITGKKLKELSSRRQVILVTHLPQIAAFADRHFKVDKQVAARRTETVVSVLDEKEKIIELAEMMSGKKQSSLSLEQAKSMLKGSQKD